MAMCDYYPCANAGPFERHHRGEIEAATCRAVAARLERLETALAHVRNQAGVWKQEARTQRATVEAVGDALGGLPDHGPIVERVRALVAAAPGPPTRRQRIEAVIAAGIRGLLNPACRHCPVAGAAGAQGGRS